MIELSGSVQSDALGLVLLFIASLGRNGRLRVIRSPIAGDISFSDGNVVEAVCGFERGLAALDLLLTAPGPVDFTFIAMRPAQEGSTLQLGSAALRERVDSLEAARKRVVTAVPSLVARPRRAPLQDAPQSDEIILTRRQLMLLVTMDGERSAYEVIGGRALASGLGALVELVENGLVELSAGPRPAAVSLAHAKGVEPLARRAIVGPVRRLPLSVRGIAWAAVIAFVVFAGAAQLPDIVRQVGDLVNQRSLTAQVEPAPDPSTSEPAVPWPSERTGSFWVVADGYHLAPSQQDDALIVSPPIVARSADVELHARFRKVSGAADTTYGLVLHDQQQLPRDGTSDNGQFLVVAVSDARRVALRRREDTRWLDVATSEYAAADPSADLDVLSIADQIRIRVNGTEVATVEDPEPLAGGIAFYATGLGAEILVDEFNISFP